MQGSTVVTFAFVLASHLKFTAKFLCGGQDVVSRAILYADRSCFNRDVAWLPWNERELYRIGLPSNTGTRLMYSWRQNCKTIFSNIGYIGGVLYLKQEKSGFSVFKEGLYAVDVMAAVKKQAYGACCHSILQSRVILMKFVFARKLQHFNGIDLRISCMNIRVFLSKVFV